MNFSLLLFSSILFVTNRADPELFTDNDKVVLYTDKTYTAGLYSADKDHVFLLYSSWCGHCHKFAPTYREFAEAINNWSPVVDVTALDCAKYTEVCRKYNILGYPTVKFIGVTTNTSDIGITLSGDRSLDGLIKWTIERVFEDIPEKFSFLRVVTEAEAESWKENKSANKPSVIVITDKEEVGRPVMLDIHSTRVRYTLTSSEAANILGAKSSGLLVFSDDGKISYITNVEDNREKLVSVVEKLVNVETTGNKDNKVDEKQEPFKPKYVDTSLQYRLYEVDLRSAVNNAFYTEVSLKSEFSKKDLDNLKDFVRTTTRCGIWAPDYKKQLDHVHSELKSRESLNSSDWSAILKSASTIGFPHNSTFIGCEGSQPLFRGYSCSLWLLFHTMLSSCYNSKLPSHEVLQHIHGYIDSFFSCRYCRDHYLAMAERRHLTSIKDEDDAILSLWSAHNEVNERLSVEAHDPYFPKVQYPPQSVCNSCRDENGQFDTDKVLQFLLKHYRRVKTKAGRIRIVKRGKGKKKVDRK